MRSSFFLALLGLALTFFTQCSSLAPAGQSKHARFVASSTYPKTAEIYRDETVLDQAHSSNTRVVIDLSEQRARLFVGEQVALDTPCCTGRAGKRTPTGSFRIREKIQKKRSTIFGRLYRGNKVVYGGDRRKYRGSYTRFVGSALPYWMRLTGDGIGMHYSKNVKRYPASAGCIRMPMEAVTTIYYKVRRGTPVVVQP